MSFEASSSISRVSPFGEKEREKEEDISLTERTEEAAEGVFSGIGGRGSPVLQPIDRVVSIRPTTDLDLIHSIESGAAGMYTRMLSDIKSHQLNPTYRKNGEVTIQAFMLFEEVRKRFEVGDRESYKKLIAFFDRHNLGFHEKNYQGEDGVFSPEMFLASVESTAQILSYVYEHACREHLLPIFFQLALSDGGCFQARSNMIIKYGMLIEQSDAKKELLKEFVKIYSGRYSSHKLPVDLNEFVKFVEKQTGLSLNHFGVDCQNLREDELIQELTVKKYFTSQSIDLISEAFEHFTVWMENSSGRKSFKKYIKEQMKDQLTGEQKSDKNLEKMIDRMIATYPEYSLGDYLTVEQPPVKREAKQDTAATEDVAIGGDFFQEEED